MTAQAAIRDYDEFDRRVKETLRGVDIPKGHKRFVKRAVSQIVKIGTEFPRIDYETCEQLIRDDMESGEISKMVGRVALFILTWVLPIVIEALILL